MFNTNFVAKKRKVCIKLVLQRLLAQIWCDTRRIHVERTGTIWLSIFCDVSLKWPTHFPTHHPTDVWNTKPCDFRHLATLPCHKTTLQTTMWCQRQPMQKEDAQKLHQHSLESTKVGSFSHRQPGHRCIHLPPKPTPPNDCKPTRKPSNVSR